MTYKSPRDFFTPQMHDYDRVGISWHPYIMFFNGKNYKSKVVNTDSNGFRLSSFHGKEFASDSLAYSDEISLVVGGSTAFGVGATSDTKTLSSLLSQKTNILHLNLGGRAFNSTQELLLFKWLISRRLKIKDVIIVSGANDLFLSSISTSSFMPSLFWGKRYEALMLEGMTSLKIQMLRKLLGRLAPDTIDWSNTNIRSLAKSSIEYLFSTSHKESENLAKDKTEVNISTKNAILHLDPSICFWSALSSFLGFRLIYVLQPFAGWIPKQYTQEEKELFKYLDNSQEQAYCTLRQMSDTKIYAELAGNLSSICESYRVSYIDSNAFMAAKVEVNNQWLYVDRVHLTDLGYQFLADLISQRTQMP